MRGRWPGLNLAAVFCLAGVMSALAVGPTSAADQPLVTRPVRMTPGDVVPTRTYSSPAMAVDPEDDQTIIASYAEMRSAGCGVARSRDGGRTWARLKEPPLPPSYPFCFAPSASNVHFSPVAFGRNHTLYLAAAAWDVQDGRSSSVLLARSEDLGDTWSITPVRNTRGRPDAEAEQNRQVSSVAVDTSGPSDVVYVAWTQRLLNARPARPPDAVVAASTDGGRTFSDPVNVVGRHFEDPGAIQAALQNRGSFVPPGFQATPAESITAERFGGTGTRVVTGAPGTVYALWTAATNGVFPTVASNFYLSRSTDLGTTYSATQVLPPNGTLGSPVLAWSPAGGTEGTLHLVYESKVPATQGDRDIQYQRSTDGGRTWTPPRTMNDDDSKLLIAQFMPSVSVAPNGRVDVAWWDFRHDTGAFLNDVYLSSSSDNGESWSPNLRVTDRSIDRMIGPWGNGYDVRQPPGLAPTARYTLVGWDDTRNGDRDAQAQDIYGSLVQFEALPAPTSPAVSYGLAAVVGLLLAGAILSVIGVVNRRRTGPPAASRSPSANSTPVGIG